MNDLLVAIERFDLEGWASARGGTWVKSNEIVLVCPTCQKPKLSINVDKRTWHCWVCETYAPTVGGRRKAVSGAGGLIELLVHVDSLSRYDAVETLVRQSRQQPLPTTLRRLRPEARPSAALRWALPIDWPPFTRGIDAATYARLPYLAHRGIRFADVEAFRLAWASEGRYANRLLFPVFERGQLVYYQARAMWDEAQQAPGRRYQKALNPPKEVGTTSVEVLMNLDSARRHARVAIVEGPIDCVHAGASAVCTFGKKISHLQIQKLVAAGVRAVDLMWDGPSPHEPQGAWPQMAAAAPLLAAFFDVRLVYLPEGDPGSLPQPTLHQLRQAAVRYRPKG